jgi:hypothetical protein
MTGARTDVLDAGRAASERRDRRTRWADRRAAQPIPIVVAEPREPDVMPTAYEPGECTCLDGDCERDHQNE